MHFIRRLHIPALFCALAVLICELISRPFAEMGISDDGPYVLVAQKLASTGHIVFNGWISAMLGWQLYLASAFIKLFGFSFTTVRMSTLLVSMSLAFVLQRTMVRSSISERNATIGTLALALSPLYLMLSVTYLTDITGLFAIVICLYGCVRALQSSTHRATIAWLCFAVATNAIFGTSRQIAWLGILVIVPSTLWLLRAQRSIIVAGATATLAGVLFMFGCSYWFSQQLYTAPAHLIPSYFSTDRAIWELNDLLLDTPFLLVPVVALFLPELRKIRYRYIAIIAALFLGYLFLAIHPLLLRHIILLEPTMRGEGDWVGVHGIHEGLHIQGTIPIFLSRGVQVLLTIISLGGLIGIFASLLRSLRMPSRLEPPAGISWKQILTLVIPFTITYTIFLIPRAGSGWIFDRYALPLLVVALLCVVRYYQEHVQLRLPPASILLVGIVAIYGIAVIHNQFSLYRARLALVAELNAVGIPDTSVDNGFEYNFEVELQHSDHINEITIALPANAYVPVPPLPAGPCQMFWYDKTPHIHPLYAVSFQPNSCYGLASFTPVHYSRWLTSTPGTLYVVRYTPDSKP
jgi:hypothetical protein